TVQDPAERRNAAGPCHVLASAPSATAAPNRPASLAGPIASITRRAEIRRVARCGAVAAAPSPSTASAGCSSASSAAAAPIVPASPSPTRGRGGAAAGVVAARSPRAYHAPTTSVVAITDAAQGAAIHAANAAPGTGEPESTSRLVRF